MTRPRKPAAAAAPLVPCPRCGGTGWAPSAAAWHAIACRCGLCSPHQPGRCPAPAAEAERRKYPRPAATPEDARR